jgi:hypothetical protein
MASSPVSLEEALERCTDQLMIFLSERARSGVRVLQLRNELETNGPYSTLCRVIGAVGQGSIASRSDKALAWFDVPEGRYNDKRSNRGECIRLIASFLRINKQINQ